MNAIEKEATLRKANAAKFRKATKLTEIVSMALDDMESILNTPGYEIHMGMWHGPVKVWEDGGFVVPENANCGVCMAGSVMAKRFIKNPKATKDANDFPDGLEAKFNAIDNFRQGDVNGALEGLEIPLRVEGGVLSQFSDDAAYFGGEDFDNKRNARKFIKTMRKWVKQFEGYGL